VSVAWLAPICVRTRPFAFTRPSLAPNILVLGVALCRGNLCLLRSGLNALTRVSRGPLCSLSCHSAKVV
jgi:hypothetical protein